MVVGDSIKREVKQIFIVNKVPDFLNRTNIVLIPKIAGPETLSNYRPISLCNSIYKIVSKIIVARLRPHLDKLISPLQSAFVPGRRSVDNAIVIQELIHTISKKKGKVGLMAVKVDLEKAYDKLEWGFIREVLINANFPHDLVSLVMSCVSSMSTSILFNGGNVDPIFPSRGIRQGDPLSPYLFILCMEVLGHLIGEKCDDRSWNPVKSSKSGAAFSHLFFADDLVLFAKVDYVNCMVIRDVLDAFCARSGQSISENKSRVYFSPNVDIDSMESFCDILGFKSTPNLGKYLGFPIKHRGASNKDLNFVLDRVKHKLAGWKANLLSLAGRAVLIQALTSTIPAYVMQCTALPERLLNNIDRVNRNFLWGSSENTKKTHWVGWHKVIKPKTEGGLGIQSARGKNIALLAKLNWRFHLEKDAIWTNVLRSKYCSPHRLNARNREKLPCSRAWKALNKGAEVFKKGIRWIPGRNSKLSLWHDPWIVNGSLRSLIQGPLAAEEEDFKVKEVLGIGGWDWSKLSFQIPDSILEEIRSIPFSMTSNNENDRLTWIGDNRRDFDLKSAYAMAIDCKVGDGKFTGTWVWKLKTLPRIKTFIWQCLHHSIGVGVCLVQRCLSKNEVCPLCNNEAESILHRLRDYPFARNIWHCLGISPTSNFYEDDLQMWLENNCKDQSHKVRHHPLGRSFFLLLFGVYGSIRIMLSFETVQPSWIFTEILCLELQNFSIVFLIRYA